MAKLENDDDFVTEHIDRKLQGKTRRQNKRARDGEKRLHKVDAKKDRWHYDPKQTYEEE